MFEQISGHPGAQSRSPTKLTSVHPQRTSSPGNETDPRWESLSFLRVSLQQCSLHPHLPGHLLSASSLLGWSALPSVSPSLPDPGCPTWVARDAPCHTVPSLPCGPGRHLLPWPDQHPQPLSGIRSLTLLRPPRLTPLHPWACQARAPPSPGQGVGVGSCGTLQALSLGNLRHDTELGLLDPGSNA